MVERKRYDYKRVVEYVNTHGGHLSGITSVSYHKRRGTIKPDGFFYDNKRYPYFFEETILAAMKRGMGNYGRLQKAA